MKKLFVIAVFMPLVLISSCKKSESSGPAGNGENTFTIGSQSFKVDHINATTIDGEMDALDANGNALVIAFEDEFRTVGGTFDVVTNPTKPNQLQIFASTNYASHIWQAITADHYTATVTITSNGKVNVKFTDINMYSSNADPVKVSANITQP